MYKNLNAPFEKFQKNRIGIITFNYDRSLEEYLFTVLKRHHGKSDIECASKLNEIPIIHFYGKLGDLDWQHPEGRPYNDSSNDNLRSRNIIKLSAEGIKTMHDDYDRSGVIELLSKAEIIYFLGFGYDPNNLEKLGINKLIKKYEEMDKPKIVRGTAFGIKDYDRDNIIEYFDNDIDLGFDDEDSLQFLDKHGF